MAMAMAMAPAADSTANLSSDEIAECVVMPGSMVVKAEAEAAGLYRDYEGQAVLVLLCGVRTPLGRRSRQVRQRLRPSTR